MECPHCHHETSEEHPYAKTWKVEMEITDPTVDLPFPFWADHGGNPERGKHHLFIGLTCVEDARAYAKNVFPEARITQCVPCNILGEPTGEPPLVESNDTD